MIEIKELRKVFDRKVALDHLNLTIQSGEIFGLLGHNGAGKSTLIKILVSILNPTSGSVMIENLSLDTHRQELKKRIGYVPDSPDLFLQLTAYEYWSLMAAAYNVPEDDFSQRLDELINKFSMTSHQTETIASFSHGMRQKTMIIGALLSEPDIWILDEPLQGLDPQAAFDLKEMMKHHAEKGNVVLFSTHVLDSAQQLCDRLAILKQGELMYTGTMADLLATQPNQSLETIYLSITGRQSMNEAEPESISKEVD
ncbi:ABC transporter ATP-binding protein [Vagococcus vulneris]|uniref:3-dehydroquinate dehydratase n=1 Tax=Vagococcus vulneris TaxID=1977869 RepID=A0A429ZUK4_9ENTE|nr:ABC transporter ATP-binding protein [Vagococcus vulneris]RST97325.1 3-dehydroquinate dehydratase [Vagococcus vulneris]